MRDDAELLQLYAREKDETAFSELVQRYVDLVYSAAVRQVRDPHLAEDVTQMVFLKLAGKAGALPSGVVLAGWLHTDTRLTALQLLRSEARRAAREEILQMNSTSPEASWQELRPLIDEAVAQLDPPERDALLLRFFGERDFSEVAAALKVSPDAARMRVNRALEKLREVLARRGITTTAAALGAALLANSVQSAPLGTGAKVLAGVARGKVPGEGTVARGLMNWTGMLAGGVAAVLLLGGILVSKRRQTAEKLTPLPEQNLAVAAPSPKPQNTDSAAPVPTQGSAIKSLRLRVVERGTGTALADVKVDVRTFTDLARSKSQSLRTDADGSVQIQFPAAYDRDFYHRLTLSKDGYVARCVSWSVFQHDTIEDIPAEYTATLERGVEIGGIVHSPSGQGISGVKVVFSGPSPVGVDPRERNTTMGNYHTEITDANGEWHCNHIRFDFQSDEFRLEHPQFRTVTYGCNETQEPGGKIILLPQAEYLAQKADMHMQAGLVLGGTVSDRAGQPISGATVTRDRDWHRKEATIRTDNQGTFAFHDASPGEFILTAQAPTYAPESKTAKTDADLSGVRFDLSRSIGLRGSIVDQDGDPVRNAEVSVASDVRYRALLPWTARTDHLGSFFWDSSPNSAFEVSVFAYGFDSTNATVQPGNNVQVIALHRSTEQLLTSARITVVDAESQRPLESAEIGVAERQFGDVPFRAIGKTSADGTYTFKTRTGDSGVQFEARMDGYLPERSGEIVLKTNAELRLALRKGDSISGTIIGPDGQPVADAEVALCTEDRGALISGRKLVFLDNSIVVHSDANGKFQHPQQVGAHTIYVIHPAGFARVRLNKWKNGDPIQLRAWGRIAGVAMINGAPGSNMQLAVLCAQPNGRQRGLTLHSYTTMSDESGHFAFEDVPPTEVQLGWHIPTSPNAQGGVFSHSVPVEVLSGATTQVTFAPSGRTVHGKLVFAGEGPVDWTTKLRNAFFHVDQQLPSFMTARGDTETQMRLYDAFWETDAGREWDHRNRNFGMRVQSDGTFEALAVPPGEYEVNIMVWSSPNPGSPFGKKLGAAQLKLRVPDGEGDFDAGTLVVKPN